MKRFRISGSHRWLLFLALSMGPMAASALAAEESKTQADDGPKIDYVDLAARMVAGQHFDRALRVLADADLNDSATDKKRFYLLRGISHLQQGNAKQARDDLQQTIKLGTQKKDVFLYLGQAHFRLEEYEQALAAFARAGAEAEKSAAIYLLRTEAHWKLDQKVQALSMLDAGRKRFADSAELDRRALFYLIDMGLYQAAADVSDSYLARSGIREDDYVAVGEALRAAGQYAKAQLVLEGARLRFPESERVALQLAHAYLDAGHPVTAGMLFEAAARVDPKYTLEAAEVYKQAGLVDRAMFLNTRVSDQKAKTKQRLALVLASERYESVAAMLPKLKRLGLLSDDNVRYALAYAFHKTQRFAEAEEQLKAIKSPEVFEAALQLRKAMAACKAAGWECNP